MKFLGALLIVVSCGLFGLDFYKKCVLKSKYTQGLIGGFEFIKSEISFSKQILSDVLLKSAAFSGDANTFFESIGNETNNEGVTLSKAFESNKHILKVNTTKQGYSIVKDVVFQLGTSDATSQMKLLDSAIEKLKIDLELQNTFCAKEGVIYKKVGFILGIGVSLLLL